jgi:hypothetical protein
MTDRDIVDDIDRLVDEQIRQEASGYDHNINQAKCPQPYCDADWHGLPVKQRMRRMRDRGHVDPTYVYADDDSPIICPGSLFEGEFTPPERPDQAKLSKGEWVIPAGGVVRFYSASSNGWRELGTIAPGALRFTPDTVSDEVAAWGNAAPIRTDVQRTMSVEFTVTNPGLRDSLLGRSPIIDMDTVYELRRLYASAPLDASLAEEWNDAAERMERSIVERVIHEAGQRFPGVSISPEDVHIERAPDPAAHCTLFRGCWQPHSNEAELRGGPSHGQTYTFGESDRYRDVIYTMRPYIPRFADFDNSNTVANIPAPIEYRCSGWNTETRRWVYSTDSDWRPQCGYCRRQSVRDLDDKYCQGCIRDLIIAESHREGVRYAQQHGIRRPVVATHESHFRGMDLEMFRVHVVSWPNDNTCRLLRQCAALAGRPLESFYANTFGEQAA